jgi:uncharacterized protein
VESSAIYSDRSLSFESLFKVSKPIIATLHLQPLPGSAFYGGEPLSRILEVALKEVSFYLEAGIDGVIVENHGDVPFVKENAIGGESIAAMSVVASKVREVTRNTGTAMGINVLANAGQIAVSVAKAAGADFVRVNEWVNGYVANEGFVEGKAGEILRHRSRIFANDIKIFADVHVKHGSHSIVADRSLRELSKDATFFCADVLIATGSRTGDPPTAEEIQGIRVGDAPVVIGSGLRLDNLEEILTLADGAIVASYFKEEGVWQNPVAKSRVVAFMMEVRRKFRAEK